MIDNDKEITYVTSECLIQTVNIMHELGKNYDWENEYEFESQTFILSTLAHVLVNDEFKDELVYFFNRLGEKIIDNKIIINQAKRYANITKGKK